MSDPRCGTYAGRLAHTARDETPCDACRFAAAEYQRHRRRFRLDPDRRPRLDAGPGYTLAHGLLASA